MSSLILTESVSLDGVTRSPHQTHHRQQIRTWPLRLLAPAVAATMVLASALTAQAETQPRSVAAWITHSAVSLDTADPGARLDDLAPLGQWFADAEIVGLGESVHGATEEITLKHRILRLLVEQLGFRSVAWEEDWTTGLQVNGYIRDGEGDLDARVRRMSPQWQSRQVADVLQWLRDFNADRADKVQFVGVEYYFTGPEAYDAVEAYVASVAREQLPELRGQLQLIRPAGSNMFEHIQWYMGQPDKDPYIRAARQVHELVDGLAHAPGDRAHALVLHHARQIVSFYEHFNLPDSDALAYREGRAAESLRWWRDVTGDKVVYWAASPHAANAPRLRIAVPPDPDMSFPSAGSYLRRWYGQRYLSIGFTFDRGTVSLGPGATATMPQPAEDWFERPFGEVGLDQFALDLRMPAPPPVRSWLEAPVTTRGLSDRGPDSYMTGGSLAEWFDVIVHRQEVTPVLPVGPAPEPSPS
jgi:erythromycin esterase